MVWAKSMFTDQAKWTAFYNQITAPPPKVVAERTATAKAQLDEVEGRQFMAFFGAVTGQRGGG